MPPRRKHYIHKDVSEISPVVETFLLRLLVPLECHRQFIGKEDYSNDEVALLFDLPGADEFEPFDARQAQRKLVAAYQKESHQTTICFPETLERNLHKLAALIGLNDVEVQLLGFAVLLDNSDLLNESCGWLGRQLSPLKMFNALSVLLGIPQGELRKALAMNATLVKTGLMYIEKDYKNNDLGDKITILSHSFSERLFDEEASAPIDWLKDVIVQGSPPHLTLANYPHLKNLDLLLTYLQHAVEHKAVGVNVFIYGIPGTGKSQLVKLLAHQLGCPLYEVASEDDDGDSVEGKERLSAVRAAQAFLKNTQALLLFDEVEDVFTQHSSRNASAQSRKAWMNRLLEENPVPTFWLCNDIESVDPAFMRRFDWVIELPVPPKSEREKILRENCTQFLTDKDIKQLASCEELAPAIVTRATKVINTLTNEFAAEKLADGLQYLINSTLVAQGHKAISHTGNATLSEVYDPELINCDADLVQIAKGIKRDSNARLCLFGVPGSGKSAYARWLADYLDKPLHVKRGSDLISKWVGETEKNIERIFRDAQEEKAVLLIDEVDSFLRDRNLSEHSWEVTEVNEMLTRMEMYEGVFIASTNRLDGLDAAALRRFDLKVKFESLKPAQALKLLKSYCQCLELPQPNARQKSALQKLDFLTPGDFAVLQRQQRFRPITDVDAFIEGLRAECAIKTPNKRQPIGFI